MSKINVSISADILGEIDTIRKEKKMTRSEFLRRASKKYLEALAEEKKEIEKQRGIEKAIKLQEEVQQAVGDWDSAENLKKWRRMRR